MGGKGAEKALENSDSGTPMTEVLFSGLPRRPCVALAVGGKVGATGPLFCWEGWGARRPTPRHLENSGDLLRHCVRDTMQRDRGQSKGVTLS